MSNEVYVAAFRPFDPTMPGPSDFDWFYSRDIARLVFSANATYMAASIEHAIWTHTTELDLLMQPQEITDEIYAVNRGWFPHEARSTATVWRG